MKLILPFPPSVNTYWRHPNKGAFAGKSLISAAGRKFQSAACAAIVEQLRRLPKPTSAPASVEIVLFPPDAARLLQGDISVLLPPPSSGKNFVEQVQKMWRTGKRLYGNASDLVTMIKTLSGVSLGSDLQPRGVWKTDSKTTATATQQRNVVASTLRTTAISEAAYAVTRLPAPTTSAVMQNAAVGQATTAAQSTGWPSVTHPALNNAPAVKNTVDLPTWEELTDIRDTLNTAIDKELSRTTSDALFLALRRVKADLNADINTRLEQSARIIQRTPDEVLPALVLAATWFDNAARDADIIRRNAITHPGFVPVIPLKVPVQ